MAEYVNLDDMLEQFDKRASKLVGDRRISVESMREFIVNRPRANVKEIVYAHWIDYQVPHISCCSYCDWAINPLDKSPYCPNCGAEMREVVE